MWIAYPVLACKLATSFSAFSVNSFSLLKMVNHYEGHLDFQDIEHQLRENILYHFHDYSYLWDLH